MKNSTSSLLILAGALSGLIACGEKLNEYTIEGILTTGPLRGWEELPIRSDATLKNQGDYTKLL